MTGAEATGAAVPGGGSLSDTPRLAVLYRRVVLPHGLSVVGLTQRTVRSWAMAGPPSSSTLTFRQLGALLAVAAVWGAAFLFIRVAAPVLGPVALIDARMGLAGLLLLAYAASRREAPRRMQVGRFLVLGALWAAPFVLIAIAELRLTASLASVLNATTPMFAALLAIGALGERLTPRKAVGLLVGVAGVVIVVGGSPLTLSGPVLLSAGASLLAAVLYAVGGIYTARAFRGITGLTMAAGQQLAGGALLLPLLAVAPPGGPLTAKVALAVIGLVVASTALGFVLFFRLLSEVGPTSALTTTYLVPVFGILWGALFLGEPLGWSLLAGLAVVLASIGLVAGVPRPRLGTSAAPPTRTPAVSERPVRPQER